jgi:hypothetical protein
MDTVILPSTEASAPGDGVQDLPRSAGYERGVADTAFRGVVTPPLAHHYSEGIIVPGRCCWCGMALYEHVTGPTPVTSVFVRRP